MSEHVTSVPIAPLAEQAHGAEQLDKLRDEIALPVACTELGCERRFATSRALKMHGTLVHGWTPHPGYKYAKAAREKKLAVAVAASVAKFKCKQCGVVFAAKWRLASHTRIEHPRTPKLKPAEAFSAPLRGLPLPASYNYCKNCGVKL